MKDEILSLISRPVSWMKPLRLSPPDAWVGHIPFAYWLIEAAAPRRLVELGTHSGNSYLAFLQAVDELKLNTQCFAVDTWRGDEHAGFYDEQVYEDLEKFHNSRYQSFSRLVRSTFEEALSQFDDGSVDIAHLDGLHTYEAVKGDFESWLPKLSERGIVLLHDINVRENHFGVWRLWEELKETYPNFSFLHSHGLGILLVGRKIPDRVKRLHQLTIGKDEIALRLMRAYFGALGSGLLDRYESAQVLPLRHANTAMQEQLADITQRNANTEAELQRQLADSSLRESKIQMHFVSALEELQIHRQRSPSYESLQVEIHKHVASLTELENLRERSGYYEKELAKAREQHADSLRLMEEIRRHLDATLPELENLRGQSGHYEEELAKAREQHADSVREVGEVRRHLDAALPELEKLRGQSGHYEKELARAHEHHAQSVRQIEEIRRYLDAAVPELQQVREQTVQYEGDFVKFQMRFADSVREGEELRRRFDAVLAELDELRRHFDAALAELEGYRNRTPGYDALKATADGWRHAALESYCRQIGQFHSKIAKGRHGSEVSIPALVFKGVIQRVYSAGYHQIARLLLILRHPKRRDIRRFRFGIVVRKHEDTVALMNLLGSYPNEAPVAALFDREFYLRNNPDVEASGQEPYVHYVMHGADDDRQPHPLFDAKHYRMSAAAVGERVGSDVLLHYIECGGRLRIDPHPYFYSKFYLDQIEGDVSRIDHPLFHYLIVGEPLGLRPNPEFDPSWYLSAHPDVSAANLSPLGHYVEFGQREARFTDVERSSGRIQPIHRIGAQPPHKVFRPREFAPTGGSEIIVSGKKVDVIIPVYGGFAETKRCVERVIKSVSQNRILNRVVLVDDCGPDPAIGVLLDELADNPQVHLVRNERNLGFVESVNRGMSFAGSNDVVLLNSDTEVVGNWLDRLTFHAYAGSDVGSVTPFSNNATICSYPSLPGRPDLPKGQTVETLDNAFRIANAGRSVDLPTAVGFCMYIKRACLDEVGLFDAETFGKGYGEENDFCLRSAKLGWRHILAGDVFVYHVGEVSFSEKSKKAKEFAWQLLTSRYPEYAGSVARFVERDPAIPLRAAATAVLYQTSGLPVVLHLTHRLGGGTAKHVYSVANLENDRVRSLVLEISASGNHFSGRLVDKNAELDLELEAESVGEIADMLKTFGVSRVHVHHVYGFADHIEELLKCLSLPYDLTIHDYMLICPRINLVSPDGNYCGEPDESGCLACLRATPVSAHPDIIWWRLQGESLILGAERVICPSQDVANRMARYVSSDNLIVVPHEIVSTPRTSCVPLLRPGAPMRIAVLGIMAGHKGGAFLVDCADYCRLTGLDVEIIVIGAFDDPILGRAARESGIRSTGYYDDSDLQGLIAQEDPHLILYPQRWPETFSYTLSAGLISGRPLLAPRIGAFIERLAGDDWARLYEPEATPSEIVAELEEVRLRILTEGPIEMVGDTSEPLPLNRFYLSAYDEPNSFLKSTRLEMEL
jgi:GT2 family glycosyltransferase/predicted  nucleic acid-binding Zn-ribbon protein